MDEHQGISTVTEDQIASPDEASLVLARINDVWGKAKAFAALERATRTLSNAMPARTSLRQALAFIFVASRNSQGQRVTMTDIRDSFRELDIGSETNGQSLAKSFALFTDEVEFGGLGWIAHEIDRNDKRKKYLRLTANGAEVANLIISHIHNTDFQNDPVQHQSKT